MLKQQESRHIKSDRYIEALDNMMKARAIVRFLASLPCDRDLSLTQEAWCGMQLILDHVEALLDVEP